MRNSLAPLIALLAAIPVACSTSTEVDNGKTGGVGPVGGSVSSSGGATSGGAPTTGGTSSSGGIPGSTGGVPGSTGGVPGSTGGVPGSTGGNRTGGAPSSGGVPGATGGTTSLSGGAPSSGGIPGATGGTGTCTDGAGPPNGTCADAVAYGWCGQSWLNGACALTCGLCGSGTGGTSSTGGKANTGGTTSPTGGRATGGTTGPSGGRATGGTTSPSGGKATGGTASGGKATGTGGTGTSTCGSTTNPAITGSNGWASRYWDCCKPSCSWTTAVPSCGVDGTSKITNRDTKSGCDSGGSAYECYDFAPWYDSATNMSYGFAAYNGASCGTCFQLQFTGQGHNSPAKPAIAGMQMIVQVINIGGIESGQFDLLIPGGGVGAMTAGCTAQWGNVDLGATYGGLLTECNGDVACTKTKCQSVFAGKSALLAGCAWFTDCYQGADNPTVIYKQVTCPSQITSKTGVSG